MLRIVSWNMQWGRGVDGHVDLARIARVARQTADFDLLCLQEVAVNFPRLPGNDATDQPARLGEFLPGYRGFFAPGSDLPEGAGGRSQFGNLIFSRLPVWQVFRHLLPWPADFSAPSMQRMALELVVEAPWGPLRIVTTHLEYYSAVCRRAQIDGLRALHGEACAHGRGVRPDKGADQPFATLPRPASAVVCGDFNFPPEAPEHGWITAPFDDGSTSLLDAWNVTHPGLPHAHSVGLHGADWPDHPYCCDFLFLTPDLAARVRRVEVNQETDASDHQPVLLELAD